MVFCGDLDMGAGDCDLMFLAEEPLSGAERLGSLRGKVVSPI